jgi:excinuclease ABC subunit C
MDKSKINFKQIPAKPGVYFFTDKDDQVLYVGKAISLRSRLRQYFRDPVDKKTKKMLEKAVNVNWQEVESELQAVIAEAKWIKQYRPKYNVQLKDNKRHLYLAITDDQYPRVKVVRRPELEDDLYFWSGPFPSSRSLKQLLRWVRKIFPFCTCKPGKRGHCLYKQIDLCPDPDNISSQEYKKNIEAIIMFFSGQSDKLLNQLKQEMEQLADQEKFEQANEIKKQITHLERLIFSQRKLSGQRLEIQKGLKQLKKLLIKAQGIDPFYLQRIEGYDIANLKEKEIVGSMVVLTNGELDKKEYRKFNIRRQGQDDPRALAEVLSRRLNHQDWPYPQLIVIDGGLPQLRPIIKVLQEYGLLGEVGVLGIAKEKDNLVVPVFKPEKDKPRFDQIKFKQLSLPKNSPGLHLIQLARDEAHRFAQKYLHQLMK